MKLISFLFLAFASLSLQAQVPLNAVIEHFTNTKCSICANRNPGLNANLAMHPEVMHLSVHPSSPYETCFLSQQNTVANDARTNFYDLYGGTPRIVLNGVVVPGSVQYTSTTLFDAVQNLTTSYAIDMQQQKFGDDSIRTRVVVKTVSTPTVTDVLLFIGLAEDTINQNGGNGEASHYHVLRSALTAAEGQALTLPTMVGDSVVADFTVPMNNMIWNVNRIYSVAILQAASDKKVLQSGSTTVASSVISENATAAADINNNLATLISPNPTQSVVSVKVDETTPSSVSVFDIQGKFLFEQHFVGETEVNLSSYAKGTYIFQVVNGGSFAAKRVILR